MVAVFYQQESTYYKLRKQHCVPNIACKVLTAYTTRKFHIASPSFRPVITKRIKYALNKILPQVDTETNNNICAG